MEKIDTTEGKITLECTPEVAEALEAIREHRFFNNAEDLHSKSWAYKIKNIRVNLLKKTDKSMSI